MEEEEAAAQRILQCRDFFQLFGVGWSSSSTEVRKKFHALARRFHPDRCKAPGATDAFQHINEGLQVLTDSGKRTAHIQTLQKAKAKVAPRPTPRPPPFTAAYRPTLEFIQCYDCRASYGVPADATEHHWCPRCGYFTKNPCTQQIMRMGPEFGQVQCSGMVHIYSHKMQSQCNSCKQLYATKVDAPMGVMAAPHTARPPQSGGSKQAKAPKSAGIKKQSHSRGTSSGAPPADAVQAVGLPDGWLQIIKQRAAGATAGQQDKYFFSPAGRKFRSVAACRRYIDESTVENLD